MVDLDAAAHTNRELELMTAGTKPLAMFYAEVSELPDERLVPEQIFARMVKSGQVVRSETEIPGEFHEGLQRNLRIKYVFFAQVGEEWRIPAMALLLKARVKGGWNETCERMESALLGYTEAEIDAWCKSRFHRQLPARSSDAP